MGARYAIYFALPPHSRLGHIGSMWLGWDAYAGLALPTLGAPGLTRAEATAITESPRRYGFHATLKAPFELHSSASERGLRQVLAAFAQRQAPISVRLSLGQLKNFLALVPATRCPPLEQLAAACVENFEPFRAPLSEFDLARHRRAGLSPRQEALLRRWGYPYVMEEFRFHMTLTGSLDVISLSQARAGLLRLLEQELEKPVVIDGICLFKQPERGERFRVVERYRLGLDGASRVVEG